MKTRLILALATAALAAISQFTDLAPENPPATPTAITVTPPIAVQKQPVGTTRAPGWPPQLANTGSLRQDLRLIKASDGDSLIARTPGGEELRIRLSGIDSPEKAQPGGREAQRALQTLLGRPFEARLLKRDGFGRWLAILQSADGQDVNHAQILMGHAWYFKKYERDVPGILRQDYAQAETLARQSRRGLWAEPNPQPPWKYRSDRRR